MIYYFEMTKASSLLSLD